jgi:hypothetical protein
MNNHSPHLNNLRQAGFQVTSNTLDVIMLRSLVDEIDAGATSTLFGLGTHQFMMSWMDVT